MVERRKPVTRYSCTEEGKKYACMWKKLRGKRKGGVLNKLQGNIVKI